MCGIYGIFHYAKKQSVDFSLLQKSNDSMFHRGPDGGSTFVDQNLGFGHRRLSIIDIEGGAQPMATPDHRYTVVFNGEIYNFLELRAQLISEGHQFLTHSDTEVVLKLFTLEGLESFRRLRGMFAIAIWDSQTRHLTVCRDRIGIKPFYIFDDGQSIQFASEIKAIIASGHYKTSLNEGAVGTYLKIGYLPGTETMFKGIMKLSPGSYRVYSETVKPVDGKFWTLPTISEDKKASTLSFSEKLAETVKQHMISDVPVGAFLSGGLDSSAIVAMMSQFAPDSVNTFAVGYIDSDADNELPFAKQVAEHFKTRHHEFVLEPTDFLDSIDRFLEHCEEPIGEPQSIAFHKLADLAQPHVKVMLSGEGADEILGGYGVYSKMMQMQTWGSVGRLPVVKQLLETAGSLSGSSKVEKVVEWLTCSDALRYKSVNATQATSALEKIIQSPKFLDLTALDQRIGQFHEQYSGGSYLRTMNSIDLLTWMPDNSLIRGDKMSMAASIEVRVPFLDHELIEYCLQLPDGQKISNGIRKIALRESMKGRLPESILHRPKKGFTVPLSSWFKGKLFDEIQGILTDEQFLSRGFIARADIETLINRMTQGHTDAVDLVFRFLVLELWIRKYCGGSAH
jgi:asparagine synthase (glutamine-hydrolysing)